ncbi:MAG: bifunctional riboflavin kinase/FAD synthetase [Phreatobacter sp.]|uniref:bifunctional riboflavin kinase/FAD synthetase n=1 Tax=Phreatobacter sp. TaxID=1966341 RepID=UPI001A40EC5E|nr:bifunctional riboflavin kinase/FAD synthetase [Phreatobacter sp.]MBL8569194.1 bifunctional riboflavin kinase/FAD synthetase [Phreatobacter sp.]
MPLILPPPRPRADFPVVTRDRRLPDPLRGGVVAVGNFDGVHLGHRHVLAEARALAAKAGSPAVALTFEPHPRAFFQPAQPMFRLTSPETKARLLAAEAIDAVAVAAFDAPFAALSADQFVSDVLIDWLGASHVVVGRDFHYGAGRAGSPGMLREAGSKQGFAVTEVGALLREGAPVSSSSIRTALSGGDLATARDLLGRDWFVTTEVIHGDKRGRDLGYPTANLRLAPGTDLRFGIYAVKLGIDGVWRDGVASFGRRPTFDNGAPLLEVHVFDFAGDLYGRSVDVVFAGFIRDELKFDGIEALVAQMDRDSLAARDILKSA